MAYLVEEGVKGLVYSGDKDFVCNWRGGEAWTDFLFNEIYSEVPEYKDWMVDGEKAGEYREEGALTFLRVFDAGHMVPMDQPKNALDMVDQLLRGKSIEA